MPLSNDQQNAADIFMKFLLGSDKKEMALEGHSGTGKTFVTQHMIASARKSSKLLTLLTGKDDKINVHCTATTNKAASVLAESTKEPSGTIHSLLGLKVMNNYNNGSTSLQKTNKYEVVKNSLVIIDEASMENKNLLEMIRESTTDCKVLHILDPYQLLPVYENTCPVQELVKHKAVLQTPQRFKANSAIPELGEAYRKCIDIIKALPPVQSVQPTDLAAYNLAISNAFPKIEPHGKDIQIVSGHEFQQMVIAEFGHKNLEPNEAKIVAWTNNKVNSYNEFVRALHTNSNKFLINEVVMTNKPILAGQGTVITTDSLTTITNISKDAYEKLGILGWDVELDGSIQIFVPCSQATVKQKLAEVARKAKRNKDWSQFFLIKEVIADLRPIYASTVHKSQGSTYRKTFVDLSDIGANNNPEEVARLLYVATTRPSDEVIVYGKLPSKYGG